MTRKSRWPSLEERFWANVQKDEDCWLWTGARKPKGYGDIRANGVRTSAHRVSYELHFGPIPEGLLIRHSCDNPPCVNPAHLSVGTVQDNGRDMATRGRQHRQIFGEEAGLILAMRKANRPYAEIAERTGRTVLSLASWVGRAKRGQRAAGVEVEA